MASFNRNIAIVIGINQYQQGIPPLKTAVNDAYRLSQALKADHGYQIGLLCDQKVTLDTLRSLLLDKLPTYIQADDRFLFYFAGHGLAFNGDDGPEGYLIPQDAKLGDSSTYLPMTEVHDALTALTCRHFLGIFDCCFAGAFRWSATRDLSPVPEVIHKERYERFLLDPAWQVITSAADDQKAFDALSLQDHRGQSGHHSPFAAALLQALTANSGADTSPPATGDRSAGDGVITATELYQYLRDTVEPSSIDKGMTQTPGLWPLNKHGKGEFIFLVPGRQPDLPDAPPLNEAANPYRGLESFEETHRHLFFGRQPLIQELQEFVEAHPLTVVLGASGTGKSSLVKAGLVPALKQDLDIDGQPIWQVLAPIRPGATPVKALIQEIQANDVGLEIAPNTAPDHLATTLNNSLKQWQRTHPGNQLLLVIDQAEELFSLCRDTKQRQQFLAMLSQVLDHQHACFHIVLTLRSDFEPQFRSSLLDSYWSDHRFVIRPMNREELRVAIEAPASAKVMYFDPPELVDRLIDEVNDMPGALPLLSFTLRELFLKYLRTASTRTNRAITEADYEELGGIKQALVNRADEEYQTLVDQDSAYENTIRRVMLRMVAAGSTGNTRRQVLLPELDYQYPEGDRVPVVIERFKEARLLVSDTTADGQPYLEPAHDALVEGWPRLLQWLESTTQENQSDQSTRKGRWGWARSLWSFGNDSQSDTFDEREKLLLQRRLTSAANDWRRKKKAQFLWHADARLPLLKQIRKRETNWFNNTETEFVQRSLGRKRFNVGLRWAMMFSLLAASVGVGFGVNILRVNANLARDEAQKQTIEAQKNRTQDLVNRSQTQFESDQHLEALMSALEAVRIVQSYPELQQDPETTSRITYAIHHAFYGSRELMQLPSRRSALSPSGTLIATLDEIFVRVWSTEKRKYILEKEHDIPIGDNYREWLINLSFNPDETLLLVTRRAFWDFDQPDQQTRVWKINGDEVGLGDREIPLAEFTPNPDWIYTFDGLYRISDNQHFEFNSSQLPFISADGDKIAWSSGSQVTDIKNFNRALINSGKSRTRNTRTHTGEPLGFIENGAFILTHQGDRFHALDQRGNLVASRTQDTEKCLVGQNNHSAPDTIEPILSPYSQVLVLRCGGGSILLQEFSVRELSHTNHQRQAFELDINFLGDVKLFDLSNVGNNLSSLSEISFSKNQAALLITNSQGNEYLAKYWMLNKKDIQQPKLIEFGESKIFAFGVSSDGGKIVALNQLGQLLLWNENSQHIKEVSRLEVTETVLERISSPYFAIIGHSPPLAIIKFISQKSCRSCFAVALGKTISVFDRYGKLITRVRHDSEVTSFDLHPRETQILSSSTDGVIKLWDYYNADIIHQINTQQQVTAAKFEPTGFRIIVAHTQASDSLAGETESFASLRLLDLDDGKEIVSLETGVYKVLALDFISDHLLIFSGITQSKRTASINIFNLEDVSFDTPINVAGSSDAKYSSIHPLGNILAVGVTPQNSNASLPEPSFWHVSGEILSDFKNLNFGDSISDQIWNDQTWYQRNRQVLSTQFSQSGLSVAALINEFGLDRLSSSGSKNYVAIWSFDMNQLADKSCELLANHLMSPLATETEKALCDNSLKTENLPSKELTPLPTVFSAPTNTAESNLQKSSSSDSNSQEMIFKFVQSISESRIPDIGTFIDEQAVYYQINTQSAAWDIEGVRGNLERLKASKNQCFANFARRFDEALTELSYDGFFQINDIKRELNEQEGCGLPIVSFEFAP
ncbi:MAG: caspase family protein [Leptolyngbyaceae cyanobacterium]